MNDAVAAPFEAGAPATTGAALTTTIAAGALLGVVYTLAPMTVWFAAASVVIVWLAGRDLPPRERRWVRVLLVIGLATRAAMVAALFVFGTPDHMWFNTFFGDEQYLLVRSMRLRHLWLGSPVSLEALSDLFDLYGQTSYVNVIAYVQLLVGQAPYGIHLLNALFYVVGVTVLHRLVRNAFGRIPALGTLFGVLFFPTLLLWSASGLKESLNFLVVICVLAAVVAVARAELKWRPLAAVAVLAGLAALRTFRAGAFEITAVGIAVGVIGAFMTRRRWRLYLAVVAVSLLSVIAARNPRVQSSALTVLRPAARMHLGHVFTRGHSYKLLDQRFYDTRVVDNMTWGDGLRFVRRAVESVLLFPRPWDAESRAELLYMPEQIAWYIVLVTAVFGVIAGLRRDALVTSLFTAYSMVALMIVALNTGNVGTLVRHRSFALPFLIALSTVGVTTIVERTQPVSFLRRSARMRCQS